MRKNGAGNLNKKEMNNNNEILNIQYNFRGLISQEASFTALTYLHDNKIDIDFTNTHIKACLCNT